MRTLDDDLLMSIKEYCESYYLDYGKSPSRRDTASKFKISTSKVQRYLEKLEELGEITFTENRGITTEIISKANSDMVSVALVGLITCGPLSFAEENITEYFKLPVSLFGRGEFFALQASGDSMINAGINDGDLVLIRKQNTAEEGEIIVALVDDETTLKRFYRDKKNKRFILHPENEKYDDIIVDNLVIQGIVTKVLKDVV